MAIEHSAMSAQSTSAKLKSAQLPRRIAVEQRRYAAEMADIQG